MTRAVVAKLLSATAKTMGTVCRVRVEGTGMGHAKWGLGVGLQNGTWGLRCGASLQVTAEEAREADRWEVHSRV